MGPEADHWVSSALRPSDQAWPCYRRRQAKRYLEAEDRGKHYETGGFTEGELMRGYVVVFEGDSETGFSAHSPGPPGGVGGGGAAGGPGPEPERRRLDARADPFPLLPRAGHRVPEPAEADSVTLLDPAAA